MPVNNPIFNDIDMFQRQWETLAEKTSIRVKQYMKRGWPISKAIRSALSEFGAKKKIEKFILEGIEAAILKSGVKSVVDPNGFRNWWLNKTWPKDKLNLSRKLIKAEYQTIMIDTINISLRGGKTMAKLAKDITDAELIRGDISKRVDNIVIAARRASIDVPISRELRKDISKFQSQVNRLAAAGAPTSRLKKAYQNIINVVEAKRVDLLDKAVDRAVKAKARYNAERIARTEMARAYGEGMKSKIAADEDAIGTHWMLSTRHPKSDICDFNANADNFGMGAGKYPKGQLPAYPAHPHCLCVLRAVYDVERTDVDEPLPKKAEPTTTVKKQQKTEAPKLEHDKWIDGLTEEENRIFNYWSGIGYEDIRKAQIGKVIPAPMKKRIQLLEKALDKAQPQKGIVWRGVSDLDDKTFEQLKTTKSFKWSALSSSSISENVGERFAFSLRAERHSALFKIHNKSGVYIGNLGEIAEKEVILRKGASYRILSQKTRKIKREIKGKIRIQDALEIELEEL